MFWFLVGLANLFFYLDFFYKMWVFKVHGWKLQVCGCEVLAHIFRKSNMDPHLDDPLPIICHLGKWHGVEIGLMLHRCVALVGKMETLHFIWECDISTWEHDTCIWNHDSKHVKRNQKHVKTWWHHMGMQYQSNGNKAWSYISFVWSPMDTMFYRCKV
jgi:hypothetical protein